MVTESIVDGPGIRLALFTQGCPHGCPGCHNPETHDFAGGYDCDTGVILNEFSRNPLLRGITLTGGEPLCRPGELLPLAGELKGRGKDICCYTGYTLEQLLPMAENDPALAALLPLIDILIDGPFVEGERDLSLRFRGSRNQRVLNLPASLLRREAVWMEGFEGDTA
jgi:anaerobic ribonucleoside-triphosphate reductase activating protein